jgi:hypothetical protein
MGGVGKKKKKLNLDVRNIFAGSHIEHHRRAYPPTPSTWASTCIYPHPTYNINFPPIPNPKYEKLNIKEGDTI